MTNERRKQIAAKMQKKREKEQQAIDTAVKEEQKENAEKLEHAIIVPTRSGPNNIKGKGKKGAK